MVATPTRITHQDILDGTITDTDVNAANIDGSSAVASMRTLGTGAAQAAAGDHSHAGDTLVFGGHMAGTSLIADDPPDGIIAAYVLANTPAAGSLRVYKNGVRQNVGADNDYTLATATVTFNAGNLPQTGDILLADYSY